MGASKITYTDKEQGQSNSFPTIQKFTFGDANELKAAINNHADLIDNNVSTKTGAYTVDPLDSLLLVDCSSGDVVITLPLASVIINYFNIKRIDSSINTLTITTTDSELIDSVSSLTLESFENVTLMANSSQYYII